ncbi:MAG: DUF3710 domain-containing protein [Mycobacteriales bacterium]
MFKRKKTDSPAATDGDGQDLGVLEEAVLGATGPAETSGPWDLADAPGDGETPSVDLGALRIPVPPTLELRLEVDPQGNVGGATVADDHSTLQLNVFAAPRRTGIWDEVRVEIMQALTDQGVAAEEVDGALGLELHARLPSGDTKGSTTSARFVGSDGPRWFLRGLMTGPAATDPVQAKPFEEVFRGIIVVRGGEAMAPRDPLGLRIPTDIEEPGEPPDPAAPDAAYDDLNPFERGPEITEIR